MTAVLCKRFLVITLLLGVSLVELVSARVLREREAHCEAQQQSFKMKTVLVLKVNKINALALWSGFIHEAVANALSLPTGTVIYNTGTVTCTNLDQISSKLNKIRINSALDFSSRFPRTGPPDP